MKIPFFASFVLFILILQHNIRRGKKTREQEEADFWKHEFSANDVRKQNLDDLTFVTFQAQPFYPLTLLGKELSGEFLTNYPEVKTILSRFLFLENQKIVNLNGFTNTDLKYKYGVANLNTLTEYDSNYSELISLLHQYGQILIHANLEEQALTILEYAISIGTDISGTYQLCATIYKNKEQWDKIEQLKKEAEKISTSRKDSILRKLQEFDSFVN